MNDYREMVKAQLGDGYAFVKAYNAFENGELRIIVSLPGEQFETRYIIHFEGEDVKLEHRP